MIATRLQPEHAICLERIVSRFNDLELSCGAQRALGLMLPNGRLRCKPHHTWPNAASSNSRLGALAHRVPRWRGKGVVELGIFEPSNEALVANFAGDQIRRRAGLEVLIERVQVVGERLQY